MGIQDNAAKSNGKDGSDGHDGDGLGKDGDVALQPLLR
jgi:hypothetical protein